MCVRLTWQGRATLENFTRAIPLISGANNGTNNGWENDNGGGLEDIGATQAIHLMLMQTIDGALVLFPSWPADSDGVVSFTQLRSAGVWERLSCAILCSKPNILYCQDRLETDTGKLKGKRHFYAGVFGERCVGKWRGCLTGTGYVNGGSDSLTRKALAKGLRKQA